MCFFNWIELGWVGFERYTDPNQCLCDQVPTGAALTDFKSAWQTRLSIRAKETDGVEAHGELLFLDSKSKMKTWHSGVIRGLRPFIMGLNVMVIWGF